MQHLPLPVSVADDEAVLEKLSKDAAWTPHHAAWLAAYKGYQQHGGNPYSVLAHDFGPGVHNRQYDLYDKRKGSGEIKRMRLKKGLLSCPVCGSPVTGALDHYLPREAYAEFSIMRANLVPACGHCNSGVKGDTVHGANPERFIHPYFDPWAAQALWAVDVVPPYQAATFQPYPLPTLVDPQDKIVKFHLAHVLGTQFHLSMGTSWSSLPGQIKIRDAVLSLESVTNQVDQELRVASYAQGANGWLTALLRGIRSSGAAIEYLRNAAILAPVPPLAPAG